MSQRVLVTGGSGLLGSALVRQLCRSHDVVATYQTNEKNLPFGCGRAVKIDLTQRDLVVQLFKDQRFDVVINTAGATGVDRCDIDHDYAQEGNVDIVYSLIDASAGANFQIFQISTDYVFDGHDGPPSERWKPNPISVYGTSKLVAEEELIDANVPCTILRVCALYSINPAAKNNIASTILTTLKAGQMYTAASDLYSNPTEVSDLAEAIVSLLPKKDLPPVLHLAPEEYLSRYEFAVKIAERIGVDSTLVRAVEVDDLNLDAPRPKFAGLRSEFAQAILGRSLKSATEILQSLSKMS